MTHKLPAVPYTKVAYTEVCDADYYPLPDVPRETIELIDSSELEKSLKMLEEITNG